MCRTFGQMVAVLALGAGVGCLVWGITSAALGESMRTPLVPEGLITTASEAMGAGAGLIAVGVTTLVLSLVGGRCKGDQQKRLDGGKKP